MMQTQKSQLSKKKQNPKEVIAQFKILLSTGKKMNKRNDLKM